MNADVDFREATRRTGAPLRTSVEIGCIEEPSAPCDFIDLVLGTRLSAQVQALAQLHGVALRTLLIAGWAVLLSRLDGQSRVHLCAETRSLELDVDGACTAQELLRKTAEALHSSFPQAVAEASLVSTFGALRLSLHETAGNILGGIGYPAEDFDEATIRRYRDYFVTLLESMTTHPAHFVDEWSMLGAAERYQVLYGWNHTQTPYPSDRCLHELIEAQVERTPDAVAVVYQEAELSYRQLNSRANQLARELRARGVVPDDRIGICVPRSLEMVIGLLAILKAGAAYVPIDPAYPTDRQAYIIRDAQPRLVLTQESLRAAFEAYGVAAVVLDRDGERMGAHAASNLSVADLGLNGRHLAYVIYTSGSTGQPKGAMNEHRAIVNRLHWMQEHYRLDSSDRVLQKTPFSFDVSVWEFFWTLLSGARLVMAAPQGHHDPLYLHNLIQAAGITTLHFVPSMLQVFLESSAELSCPSLRRLICSGEELSVALLRRCHAALPHVAISNLYGPTEAAVDVTYWDCDSNIPGARVPIGRPIDNVQMYVLNRHCQPLPIGVAGDLYIGGDGVGRGYWNRPAMTAERFVADPYSAEPGSRMYKTGDLARWRADGELEYLGRSDFQVKIRGQRIELGEIEAQLLRHPGVSTAVVVAREESGEKQLVAYYVPVSAALAAATKDTYALPNGKHIFHQNRGETQFLYEEIYESQIYTDDLVLPEHACVMDVGANIGLFALYIGERCPSARILAFEPLPPIYEVLSLNAPLCDAEIQLFACGLGAHEEQLEFTYYAGNSIMSGRREYADHAADLDVARTYLRNRISGGGEGELTAHTDELLEARMQGTTYACPVRRLSDVLAEERIERVHLLKIDVERSELDVLAGIASEDWCKIERVVVEVHDHVRGSPGSRVRAVEDLLRAQGFETRVAEEKAIRGAGLYTLIATSLSTAVTPPRPAAVPHTPRRGGLRLATARALQEHLRCALPDSSVPKAYVALDRLPLSANGKIDRSALPPPTADAFARREYAPPIGATEELLAEIWADALGRERVGRLDHFFELGGHSLAAVRVMWRVRQRLGVEVAVGDAFACPVLKDLASRCAAAAPCAEVWPPTLAEFRAGIATFEPARPAPVVASREQHYPLSHSQLGLWFLANEENVSGTYHVAVGSHLRGELDDTALERALQVILARHEALRTVFLRIDDEPVQRVLDPGGFTLVREDIDAKSLDHRLAAEAAAPFDLERGPLFRGLLLKLASAEHVLLLTMHHIVIDGWSVGILHRELNVVYRSLCQQVEANLSPLPVQYPDYARWQRHWMSGERLMRHCNFWQCTLCNAPELLELPTDRPRPARQSFTGEAVKFSFGTELTRDLRELALARGCTPFMVVLAAWAAVLSRLSGHRHVVIGTPFADRTRAECEGLIGFFVNTLPICIEVDGTLAEVLDCAKGRMSDAQAHQDVPFEHIVEAVNPRRSSAYTPLFQVMMAWQNTDQVALDLHALEHAALVVPYQNAKFDLELNLEDTLESIAGELVFSTALFDRTTIERHCGYLIAALRALLRDDRQPVERFQLMDTAERHRLLTEWNATQVLWPGPKMLHQLVESQAVATPDAWAVVDGERRVSYTELNAYAEGIALELRELGVQPDETVAICIERSIGMVAGLLGILKANAAYVPLDPQYPPERLALILADCAPSAVVVEPQFRCRFAAASSPLLLLERTGVVHQAAEAATGKAPLAAVRSPRPTDLAYVIYTSGSTGQPRGVMVEHGNAVNLIHSHVCTCGLTAADRVMQFASFGFDASVEEIFATLAVGATLVLRPEWMLAPDESFVRFLAAERITVADVPTAFWHQWAETPTAPLHEALRLVVIGGEKAERAHYDRWQQRAPHLKLMNSYGPTETTVYSCALTLEGGAELAPGEITIGRPIHNTRIYVLDAHGEPVPTGVVGELYIAGLGVARGYLNNEAATAARFSSDPFHPQSGSRMYRTGDRVRLRADGSVEFWGRCDDQMKIRGFRIEPGEIAAALSAHAHVREAVVLATRDAVGENSLLACVVSNAGAACRAAELREHLARRLPKFMVPARFLVLDDWPLTGNGKIDRKALLAMHGEAADDDGHAAPCGAAEVAMAGIWAELLGHERIGRDQNFFDLGGHSLMVTQLIHRVSGVFGKTMRIRQVFDHPTVASLCALLTGS